MTLEQVNSLPSNDLSSAVSTQKSNKSKDTGFSGVLSLAAGKKINVVNSDKALNSVAMMKPSKASSDDAASIAKPDKDKETDIKDSLNNNSLKTDSKDDKKVTELNSDQKSEILDKIEDDLSVTEDQIVNAMQILGLSFQDLFDPKNLIRLMSQLLGTEDNSSALLMNQGVKDLINDFKILSAETGIDIVSSGKETEPLSINVDTEPVADETVGNKEIFSINTEETIQEVDNNTPAITESSNNSESADTKADKVQSVNITVSDQREQTEKTEEVKTDTEEKTQVRVETAAGDDETGRTSDQSFREDFFSKNENGRNTSETPLVKENTTLVFSQTYSMPEAVYETTSSSNCEVQLADSIINQIVRSAKLTLTDTSSTMEMVLNPEQLGKIYMEVAARDGAVKARILAENENVKNMLETRLEILQQDFKEQGIKVDSIEISVGTRDLSENDPADNTFDFSGSQNGREREENEGNKGRLHRIDLNNLDGLKGLMTEEELLTARIMKEEGNTLSYQA